MTRAQHPNEIKTKTREAQNATEPLLRYREAAKLLGVSERRVWQMVKDGELPAVRIGWSVRIDPADIRAFIARAKNPQEAN